MALSYTSSGNNTASSSWAVSNPAASAGDLLIFHVGWDDSTTTTGLTPPAGPNGEAAVVIEDVRVSSSTAVRGKIVYYVATGTWSAGTITFTPSASEQWSAVVVKVPSGEFDPTTPIGADNYFESTTTDSTPNLPSLTAGATDGGGTVVGFMVGDADNPDGTITGWTSQANTDRGAIGVGLWTRDTTATDSESISAATGATFPSARDYVSFIYIIREYQSSPTVSLNSPADASSASDTTPTLDFTGTDAEGDSVEYEVQVDTVNTFDSNDGLVDSYSESNQSSSIRLDGSGAAGGLGAAGEAFMAGISGVLDVAKWYIKKGGSPTGNLVAKLYNTTGTLDVDAKPTGAALATSDNVDASTLTTSFGLVTFTFSGANKIALISGNTYCITLERFVADTSNYVEVGGDSSSPTHSGNRAGYSFSTWSGTSSLDLCFYVYCDTSPLLDKVSDSSLTTETITSTQTWTAPLGVYSIDVEAWGAGGAGAGGAGNNGGGGGGAYAAETGIAVTPGNSYSITVGVGGVGSTGNGTTGGDTYFDAGSDVLAKGGVGSTTTGGAGGAAGSSVGTTTHSGGTGGNYGGSAGGGGGGGAGDANDGGTGGTGVTGTGGAGGTGGSVGGGNGGTGGDVSGIGVDGVSPGGGGGGAGLTGGDLGTGGDGASGQMIISYTPGDDGFVNPDTGGDLSPFNSGENIQFTVQAGDALAAGTYYWRVRAKDPSGTNTYGAWSSTRSFTITSGGTVNYNNFFFFFPILPSILLFMLLNH